MSQNQINVEKLNSSKGLLARLLAEENISIVHSNVPGPSFDLTSRTLHFPILKEEFINSFVYDLFMGHEVGHCLYTPEHGWHTAIFVCKRKHKHNQTCVDIKFKNYLNVCEDARIERMMKKRFPGLVKCFSQAYKLLDEKNFLGLNGRDVNKMNLIDRINVYFKLGFAYNVKFTETEMGFIRRLEVAETWDEVEQIAREIFEVPEPVNAQPEPQPEPDAGDEGDANQGGAGEQEEVIAEMKSDPEPGETDDEGDVPEDLANGGDADEDEDSSDDADQDSGESEDTGGEEEGEDAEGNSAGGKDGEEAPSDEKGAGGKNDNTSIGEEEDSDSTGGGGKSKDEKDSGNSESNEFSSANGQHENNLEQKPKDSITDNALRAHEGDLIDSSQFKSGAISAFDLGDPNKFPVKVVTVMDMLKSSKANLKYRFELDRKDRWNSKKFFLEHKKEINSIVSSFQMKKNAKRYAREHESRSGELDMNKISRYRFTSDVFLKNTVTTKGKDHGMMFFLDLSGSMAGANMVAAVTQVLYMIDFCRKCDLPYDVYGFTDAYITGGSAMVTPFGGLALVHFDSSKFNKMDHELSCDFLCYFLVNHREFLHYTPLAPTIYVARKLVTKFKADNHTDILNVIFLTDGMGDRPVINEFLVNIRNNDGSTGSHNRYFINDLATGKKLLTSYGNCCDDLMKHFKETSGINLIGFYVSSWSSVKRNLRIEHTFGTEKTNTMYETFKKQGYVSIPMIGFHKYFLADTYVMGIKDDLDEETELTKSTFTRSLKNKAKKLLVLNKFVDEVVEKL